MMFLTHMSTALLLGLLLMPHAGHSINPLIFLGVLLLSAMLPDIDIATSTVGKKARPISYFLEHRGFFHSIAFTIAFSVVIFLALGNDGISLAFLLGYGSHILLDCLNPAGVKLFWPADLKVKGRLRTGRLFDKAIFAVTAALSALTLASLLL